MTVIRFLSYLIGAFLVPFAIVLLVIAYVLLYITILVWQTWLRAKKDPRYNEHWWIT